MNRAPTTIYTYRPTIYRPCRLPIPPRTRRREPIRGGGIPRRDPACQPPSQPAARRDSRVVQPAERTGAARTAGGGRLQTDARVRRTGLARGSATRPASAIAVAG